MADQTDLYHKLLGIPPKEQPPTHYRLLGLASLESDHDVIEAAADRQMIYLRTLRSGDAEQLLNEVSRARICLLNRTKKAEYDRSLLGKPGECKLDHGPSHPMAAIEAVEVVPTAAIEKVEVVLTPPVPEECKLDPTPAETEQLFEIRDRNGPYVPLGPYSASQILAEARAGKFHQGMDIRKLPNGVWSRLDKWQESPGHYSLISTRPHLHRDPVQPTPEAVIAAYLWQTLKGAPAKFDKTLRSIAGKDNNLVYRFLQGLILAGCVAVAITWAGREGPPTSEPTATPLPTSEPIALPLTSVELNGAKVKLIPYEVIRKTGSLIGSESSQALYYVRVDLVDGRLPNAKELEAISRDLWPTQYTSGEINVYFYMPGAEVGTTDYSASVDCYYDHQVATLYSH